MESIEEWLMVSHVDDGEAGSPAVLYSAPIRNKIPLGSKHLDFLLPRYDTVVQVVTKFIFLKLLEFCVASQMSILSRFGLLYCTGTREEVPLAFTA